MKLKIEIMKRRKTNFDNGVRPSLLHSNLSPCSLPVRNTKVPYDEYCVVCPHGKNTSRYPLKIKIKLPRRIFEEA